MFTRRRRWLRAAVIGGGAFGGAKKSARRSAGQAGQGRPERQHDDEQNERLATDPEFTAAKTKPHSGLPGHRFVGRVRRAPGVTGFQVARPDSVPAGPLISRPTRSAPITWSG